MKIDRIQVYDCAIKRLKHGFAMNANCEFSPRSITARSHKAASSIYGTREEFAGALYDTIGLCCANVL